MQTIQDYYSDMKKGFMPDTIYITKLPCLLLYAEVVKQRLLDFTIMKVMNGKIYWCQDKFRVTGRYSQDTDPMTGDLINYEQFWLTSTILQQSVNTVSIAGLDIISTTIEKVDRHLPNRLEKSIIRL